MILGKINRLSHKNSAPLATDEKKMRLNLLPRQSSHLTTYCAKLNSTFALAMEKLLRVENTFFSFKSTKFYLLMVLAVLPGNV